MPDQPVRRSPKQFGPFELLEKLGQGGMSSVYKAKDTRNGAIVAIKIASHLVINDRHLSRRFELEYDLAHALDHPNLVKVIENGKVDKTPYLVMEFIDGPSLSQYLRTKDRLNEADALAILMPIADALIYLHQKQIIHRDVKPANIMLTSMGQPKLADLGLVKNLESLSQLTKSNLGLGTMQFASPEQFDDARSADARSDIYSLAATLYLLLTGEYPFGKGSTLVVVARKLKNEFDAPITKVPELRAAVNTAICQGLDADRTKRPTSMRDFAALIAPAKKARPEARPSATPAAKATPKDSRERRGGKRYAVEVEAACRAVVNSAGKRWPAWIMDVSATGLCLNAQRRFEVGNVLEIRFALKSDDSAVTKVVRVRWARPTDKRSWLLGCEFVTAMADDEMNQILADRLDETEVR